IAEELHAVMIAAGKPTIEVMLRHPAPPPNLQPLIEIELVNCEHDIDRRQDAEKAEFGDERVPIAFLQRIVEAVVPLIEHDVDGHDRELDGDHRTEQSAAGPAVFGKEVRTSKPPDDGERRKEA